MRVLVCGGRDYDNEKAVHSALDDLNAKHKIDVLMSGGAKGADLLALGWGIQKNIHVLPFLARWKIEGRAAGPIRNQRMIDEGKPDLVVAFPGGRGTADMVSKAERSGITVFHPATEGERNV